MRARPLATAMRTGCAATNASSPTATSTVGISTVPDSAPRFGWSAERLASTAREPCRAAGAPGIMAGLMSLACNSTLIGPPGCGRSTGAVTTSRGTRAVAVITPMSPNVALRLSMAATPSATMTGQRDVVHGCAHAQVCTMPFSTVR